MPTPPALNSAPPSTAPSRSAASQSAAPEPASTVTGEDGRARCAWVGSTDDLVRYHDDEWGRPVRGDTALFERIALEAFQSGLSWLTILRRREGFRAAFRQFEPAAVAAMTDSDVEQLLGNEAIIRNRRKIEATIANARALVSWQDEHPNALDALIWSFTPEPSTRTRPATLADVPSATDLSRALAATLRDRGFQFVGPTTMYALMQATGVVDDHVVGCWKAD